MQAEMVKNYVSCIPIAVDSGLRAVLFINLYKFFRENTWAQIQEAVNNVFQSIQQIAIGSQATGVVLSAAGGVFQAQGLYILVTSMMAQAKKNSNVAVRKNRLGDAPTWMRAELEKYGYKDNGTWSDANLRTWYDNFVLNFDKNQDKLATFGSEMVDLFTKIHADYVDLVNVPEGDVDSNYKMGSLEAAGWAALVLLMISAGISSVSGIVNKMLGV